MPLQLARAVATALLFLALTLTVTSNARAGVWVGAWDPPLPFNNLGWRGSATFNIPASPPCATDGAACLTGGPFIQDGQVTFFDIVTDDDIAQITWTTSDLVGTSINALRFQGSNIAQFDTGSFPVKPPSLFPGVNGADYGNFDQESFRLAFVIDFNYGSPESPSLYSGPLLFWDCGEEFCVSRNDLSEEDNRPALRVTLVPEPGSISLVAAALLVFAGSMRRQRRG